MKTRIVVIVLGWIFILGFQIRPENDRLQKALDKKIEKLKKEKWADCRRVVLQEAESYVDSLIAYEVSQRHLIESGFPDRPIRPPYDALDSLDKLDIELQPIIKK